MTDPQPDVRWAPIPPKPNNRGRIWLIVGLSVLAVAIVAALLFFLIPRGETTVPDATASPSPSASATEIAVSPSPSETTEPTEPTEPSEPTPPPPVDPDIATFRDQVSPRLDDANTGLGFVADAGSQEEAASILEQLQIDAQQLVEIVPPSSIASQWRDAVAAYSARLEKLRSGAGSDGALDDARRSLEDLRSLIA